MKPFSRPYDKAKKLMDHQLWLTSYNKLWVITYESFPKMHTVYLCKNFAEKIESLFCHNDIVTSFIYYYWRADVETRVFVEAILGIWRFFEIFANFHEFSTIFTVSSSGQSLSTNHLSKCQSHQQFCNQYKQTAWVQTVWILTERLCQIESSSQQSLIVIIFRVSQQFLCHHFKRWRLKLSPKLVINTW